MNKLNSRSGFIHLAIVFVVAVLVIAGIAYAFVRYGASHVPQNIGGETDGHGCLIAAGYSWCGTLNKCFRPFEEKCQIPNASAVYACLGGKTISAKYYNGSSTPAAPGEMPKPGGSVALVLSDGRKMLIPQTISGSGVRFANSDESFVFWNKGNTAFITENSTTTYNGCVTAAQ